MRAERAERRVAWRAALLVGAVLAIYANALNGPFIFDDSAAIVENAAIREVGSRAVLNPEREAPTAGRPVVNLSFALNYAGGGLQVRGYHIANILLHALCAVLVFAVLHQVLRRRGFGDVVNARAHDLAFAAALLWAVHPLNSEVVDYTTQRTESMMALCYLAVVYASMRAFDTKSGQRWPAMAIAGCAIGMACKESMVTAPVMVAILDRTLLFPTWRAAWARRRPLYLGLAATWLVLVAVTWSGPRIHSAGFASGVTPWTYLLNQTIMIAQYLRLAFWPSGLVLHYGEPLPLTFVQVLPAGLLVVALLAATASGLARFPACGFFGAWCFVTLAPTSSILPIATEVGAERRMYLPLVGVVALVALAAFWLGRRVLQRIGAPPRARTAAAVVATAIAVLALSGRTIARNREYESSITMAQTVCDRWPTPVAHAMLGGALEAADRHDEAVDQLTQSAAAGYSRARYHLGGALFNHHRTADAIRELNAFLAQSPELLEAVNARLLLARAYIDDKQWAPATAQLRQVLVMRPSNADALGLLADSLFAQNQLDEAIARYRLFIAQRPTDVGALLNLGAACAERQRPDEARAAFQAALQIDPRDVRVHRNLAALALNLGDAEGGRIAAQRAVDLADRDALAHDLLGRALGMQGRLAEARTEFEKALAIDPAFGQAIGDLALVKQ